MAAQIAVRCPPFQGPRTLPTCWRSFSKPAPTTHFCALLTDYIAYLWYTQLRIGPTCTNRSSLCRTVEPAAEGLVCGSSIFRLPSADRHFPGGLTHPQLNISLLPCPWQPISRLFCVFDSLGLMDQKPSLDGVLCPSKIPLSYGKGTLQGFVNYLDVRPASVAPLSLIPPNLVLGTSQEPEPLSCNTNRAPPPSAAT
jgi:hypothetical protein